MYIQLLHRLTMRVINDIPSFSVFTTEPDQLNRLDANKIAIYLVRAGHSSRHIVTLLARPASRNDNKSS